MTDNETNKNWMDDELEKINEGQEERIPSLILEENKVVNLTIDFTQSFKSWTEYEADGNTIKKIKKMIPVKVGEVELLWWVNVKNPIYTQILKAGTEGQNQFKILQTGKNENTKYSIVTE